MTSTLALVALGGAAGASARYLTGMGIARMFGVTGFPLGILTVNVLGSFLMGVAIIALGRLSLAHLNPLIATGFLGGFTTFSSFSLEAVTLAERGEIGLAGLYVVLSVGLSIGALFAGFAVSRALLA